MAVGLYNEVGDWDEVRRTIVEENLFQLNAVSSRKRVAAEVVKRLRTLTDGELAFLEGSYGDDRLAMLWVAVCRTYRFVRDLSEQVIAARYDRTIPDFTAETYDAFFEEQAEIHPELERLSDESKKKMRNQVFLMLTECRLLSDDGRITPLRPTPMFKSALGDEGIGDLLLFPGRLMRR